MDLRTPPADVRLPGQRGTGAQPPGTPGTTHCSAGLASAPWRALAPLGAVELQRPDRAAVRQLAAGADVVLLEDRLLARWRLRRLARRTGLLLDRELVAVPSTRRPLALVDDRRESIEQLWGSVVTVPPGVTRGHLAASLVLVLARKIPWTWTGALAPGRVVIARRP